MEPKLRICIFSSSVDIAILDRSCLLSKINTSIEVGGVREIYFATYRTRKSGVDSPHLFLLPDQETLRMSISRKLLRLIDMTPWIPPFLARIALWLAGKQLTDLLMGIDPDVIICTDLRWDKELKTFLRKNYPQWTCLTKHDARVNSIARQEAELSSKVSIVLPTYNGSRYIRQSIESCLKQSYGNFELIVVDDGSSDNIAEIVGCYGDSRIRFLRHARNLGLADALNTGFKDSVGEYLTWTSDDNYYADSAIEEMVRFLQRYHEVDFVYADSYVIDESDGQDWRMVRNKSPEYLAVDNVIGGCFLYRMKVYKIIGDFDARTFLAEDYDYWVRVWKRFRMQRLFKPLYYYRYHKDSLTAKYSPEEVWGKVKLVKRLNRLSHE